MGKQKGLEEKIHEMSSIFSQGGGFGDPDALRGHFLELEGLKHREKMLNDRKALYIAILSLVVAIASLIVTLLK